jgi:hypothetical protein
VHFHGCFEWGDFLTAAADNFASARQALGLGLDSRGCLMLTESAGVHAYRELVNSPAITRDLGWHGGGGGGDGRSIVLSGDDGETLMIVPGRQIVTAERLEVLALGCDDEVPDRQPIRDVLRSLADRAAVPAIPGGLGKWGGPRGRLVRDLIEATPETSFCLGDNGGRARWLPGPALFRRAAARRIPVLGGSDPLPLPSQVTRPGSYGFVLDDWRDTDEPATAILTRLRGLTSSPVVFGERVSMPQMVRAQAGIRGWYAPARRRR